MTSIAPTPAPLYRLSPKRGAERISVVLPMHDEAGGAAILIAEIAAMLAGRDFEIIAVDDCSRDHTVRVLAEAQKTTPSLRILLHGANAGQSRAVRTGVLAASGSIIVTLDGDGQNDPADIPDILARLLRDDAPPLLAMVAGERRVRLDAASKRTASRLANAIRRRVLDDGSADTGCGLKAFYREAFLRLPYFDHLHRYLPALMRREGFKVEFVPVGHRQRAHGRSKYTNIGRLRAALRDLFGVVWLKARARSPATISELEPSGDYDTM